MSQDTQGIASTSVKADSVSQYYEESQSVSKDSHSPEQFHKIRAIEQKGGMNVEIIRVNVTERFSVNSVVLNTSKHGAYKYSTVSTDSLPQIGDFGFKDTLNIANLREIATGIELRVDIFFETPYNKMYKQTIDGEAGQFKELFENIRTELATNSMSSVDDITPLNSLDGTLKTDKHIEDGSLYIGDYCVDLDSTQVDCDEQRKTNDDLITFFGNDVDLAFETKHTIWHWGHISDLREIPRKNQIGVVVQTPVHETVFPFELTHDTDTPLWKLVESNGGSIQDLRGMDICVRNRSLNLSNDFVRTLNYSRYSKNMYQPNPPRQHNIQSELKKEDSPMYLVDTECSVEPIAVDVNFMWDFGIPPVDRFTKENNLEESDSVLSQQDTESGYLVS